MVHFHKSSNLFQFCRIKVCNHARIRIRNVNFKRLYGTNVSVFVICFFKPAWNTASGQIKEWGPPTFPLQNKDEQEVMHIKWTMSTFSPISLWSSNGMRMCVSQCVCVYGMNLTYIIHYAGISTYHLILCYASAIHKHTHPQTI